jgi:two-component system copper resistance phosphate regulon response regulator CusR
LPLRVGDLLYHKRTRTAQRGGQTMTLTACEAFVLEFLMHNKGKVCSREEILAGALGYLSDPGTNVVDQTVKRLRDKVEDRSKPKLIYAEYGEGYVIRSEPG